MQTLVIGDIHGCYKELQDLLQKAGLSEDDLIVSIGDCVDRGPDTPAVLRFFNEQKSRRLIMGNHERKHDRASRYEVKLSRSQIISKMQFGDEYPKALKFMGSLPLYLDIPEALVVHGYYEAGLPVEQQLPSVLCGTMGGDKHLVELYSRPWYELYDGSKPILVGHQNYSGTDQPFVYQDRVFGLDTDCVTGKSLTGLVLPSFRFVSVPSRANHWLQVRRLYTPPANSKPHPSWVEFPWEPSELQELRDVITIINKKATEIMQTLLSDPTYADLPARKQANLFSERTGTGKDATLLHLARLGQLNEESARKVLKSPDKLKDLLSRFDRIE
jgi:serine/threonine protein phosphatase 1